MNLRRSDAFSQLQSTCIVKPVAGKRENCGTDPAGAILAKPVSMDDGAHGPVLSRFMNIDQVGRSDLANGPVPEDTWNIRDYVRVLVCARPTRGVIACVYVFFKEVCVLPPRILVGRPQVTGSGSWDSFLVELSIGGRSPSRSGAVRKRPLGPGYRCAFYLCIPRSALFSVYCFLAWCSRVSLQEVAQDMVGLRRQL